jgi:5-methylcytosine-specific restriction endonuclease McrA
MIKEGEEYAGIDKKITIKVPMIKEGLKEYRCERCKIVDYNGEHISLELNHKDGNNANHCLENLELLCPNCHSQTETYRFKNKKHIEE